MKRKKQKSVVMSKTAVHKLEEEVMQKMLILSAAYLMDDWDYSEQAICDYWDGLTRYVDAIDQKYITLDKICWIIQEHTGIEFKRANKKAV